MHKYQNPFLFNDKATVKSAEYKDNFLFIELDDTIFYPGGGGQPCDIGTIKSENFKGDVIEVFKKNDRILHQVIPNGEINEGKEVNLEIDKSRRENLVRMHTGEHILFKTLEISLGKIKLNKINLGEEESSLFIETDKVYWEDLFKAEELANKIISEDRKIIETEYSKEDAVRLGKLRIKPEKIKGNIVRVVEIKDFDWSACAGTHAPSTKYVSNLLITKFNFNKGCYEIKFKTNVKKDFFDLAKVTRESAFILETDSSNVINSIKKLQEESQNYKDKFRIISAKLLDHNKAEKLGNITFIHNIVEDVEKKQLIDKSGELLKEKTMVLFVNIIEGKTNILLNISADLKMNAPKILNKALSKFNGKGGGKDAFAMGSIEKGHEEELVKFIIDLIK